MTRTAYLRQHKAHAGGVQNYGVDDQGYGKQVKQQERSVGNTRKIKTARVIAGQEAQEEIVHGYDVELVMHLCRYAVQGSGRGSVQQTASPYETDATLQDRARRLN